MKHEDPDETPQTTGAPSALPQGYRDGLVTAVTVFLGFSLYFLRYWSLEIPGGWTWKGRLCAFIIIAGIAVQLLALYRSLSLQDDQRRRYTYTVRYFFVGILIAMIGVAAGIFASAPGGEDGPSSMADEKEISRLEDVINKAWSKRDTATVGSLLADDYQYWSFRGERRTKADLLRKVESSEDGDTIVEDPVARVYGDTAVYTARILDIGKRANGEAFTAKTCLTSVWVRRNGNWQVVADHETLVPAEPGP